MIKITGVSIFIRNPIGAAAVKDIESALMVAMVFGVTSPKISIKNVRIPVAIPAPVFPKRWMARDVEMEDAERFTILFPIRMADNIFPGFPVTCNTRAARLSPLSARVRIRIWFTVVRAVSDDEKNADRHSRIIIAIN